MALRHHCPVPGCQAMVQRGFLLCPNHWRALPMPLRRAIIETWNNGSPLRGYLRNVREALRWIKEDTHGHSAPF